MFGERQGTPKEPLPLTAEDIQFINDKVGVLLDINKINPRLVDPMEGGSMSVKVKFDSKK